MFASFGLQSDFFKFNFLLEKFDLSNQTYSHTNNARLLSYTRPIEAIMSDPAFLFRGVGIASTKLRSDDVHASLINLTDGEVHSVFGSSIFYRGFLSTVIIFYVYYKIANTCYRARIVSRKTTEEVDWILFAGLVSFAALLRSGHSLIF